MKFLPFSCLGSQTLIARVQALPVCVNIRQRPDPRPYPWSLALTVALLIVATMTGCGGGSTTAITNSVQPPMAPTISPGTGTYVGTQQVTITDATPGATIYDTTDGTVPTATSAAYKGPVSISVSSTVQAVAVLQGLSSAVTSSVLTIATPVKLAFLVQPSNALSGVAIAPAVQVAIQDTNGNTVALAANPITLALATGAGLAGSLTVTPQNGIATFSNLSVNAAGSYTLSATSPGLTSATSASFTVMTPVKLAFLVQPSNASTGAAITPAVQVAVQDANGNTVTAATSPVVMALAGSTVLGGTLSVIPQQGVATFSNLMVSSQGSYTLSATSSTLTSATSTSFIITSPPATYYLSPNGNDSNSGISVTSPWLSPNHPVNCGDVIVAASGFYSGTNFFTGKWGTVTCLLGKNVAWLQCATFDSCRIFSTTADGLWIDESYWGVQGWEITTSTTENAACFHAGPNQSAPVNVHHIIFADNVANGCMGGGFTAYNNSTSASVDYIAYVGNIAYDSARGNGNCYSGLNIYQPIASDNNAGTHLYIAGNFSYSNLDPDPCNGTAPTDGEGIILDTFDFSQGGGAAYTQQALVENNILVNNGGRGIEVFNNSAGPSHAAINITQNTSWGNLTDANQNSTGCGEVALETASDTQVYGNLISTSSATGCGINPIYALSVQRGDSSDSVDSNFAFGFSGNNTYLSNSGTFAYGSKNILGMNPNFSNSAATGAPNCQNTANVPSCVAALVSGFAPTAVSAKGFGYQTPSSTPSPDPLFPQWLCTVHLPAGLVTLGCANP